MNSGANGAESVPIPAVSPAHFTLFTELKRASRWLSDCGFNVTSQAGEDGIVAKALSLLPNLNNWCIEFGAWDGKHLSNTYNLVENHGYNVVLIEGDLSKHETLCAAYPHKDRAVLINAYVGWNGTSSLDCLLGPYSIPNNPDLLSVDVDGNDYHIWNSIKDIRPKLVLIEYNPTMPNCLDFVQPQDDGCNQGSSARAMVRLGKSKGYELVAVTSLNLLFVDCEYYSAFAIPDNSLEVMRDDEPNHIFFGYDGTVFLHGDCYAAWHGLQLAPSMVQLLPRVLRKYPERYNRMEKLAFRLFKVAVSLIPKKHSKRITQR